MLDYYLSTKDGRDVIKRKEGNSSTSKDNVKADVDKDKDGDLETLTLAPTIKPENIMYDSNIDKDNEEWIIKKRNRHSNKTDKKNISDAMLSCPACMITVCVDCQRHDLYKNQFRAMFVMNCQVINDQLLRYEHKNKSKKRRKKEGPGKLVEFEPVSSAGKSTELGEELYHPVQCTSCQTEIAVYDKDEIYHFFNVIESIA
ncbi:E2F-associated phosphoprotein-like isoform X2 [Hydractinia symbiolongicarpus]|nr:E2F-associated phosphoprotein-like isoform X2 [Hydractinia symbiolongicarpus]